MAEDFGRLTAAPPAIVLGGLTYLVAKQGPRIYGELQQAVKAHFPDPRLRAKELCRDLPDAVALRIWTDLNEEAQSWPPSIDSPEANRFLTMTEEGATAVVWALLRKHNPQLDLQKARELAAEITAEEVQRLIDLSMPEPDWLPKAPGTPTAAEEDRGPVPVPSTS